MQMTSQGMSNGTNSLLDGRQLLSDFKLQTGYLRYLPERGRKETWEEAVRERIMNGMHLVKYKEVYRQNKEFRELFDFAEQAYVDKICLGSQRSLQFGGDPILRKNSKMYNCLTSYCDRVTFFKEAMWWLLSGCGVGFSVQFQHVLELPNLRKRTLGTKTYIAEDSIEGWADCIGVLVASYFREGDDKFAEYYGYEVKFDLSQIREKGAPISSGFKAPGPEPLKVALDKIEKLINNYLGEHTNKRISPIICYDIVMFASNAVLAGGVRRSATICIFSKEDSEMLNAKVGMWYIENAQRSRSNNSVALLKSETTKEEFLHIMEAVKQYGEPGFVWLDDLDILYNPCVEIGMYPKLKVDEHKDIFSPDIECHAINSIWKSGWQGCNLTEINGAACTTKEIFFRACKASAILGTLQAGYTDFEYVGRVTEEIFRKEALLGCSITGWMNNPDILFNEKILEEGVQIIKYWNEKVAEMIGINPAARLTCSKPSGNAAVILMSASGMKPEESRNYLRYVQVNKDEYGIEHFKNINPEMVEVNSWDEEGYTVAFPHENRDKVILKRDLTGVKHLEYVLFAQKHWVEPGTIIERCTIPELRHNISNTIGVDNWDEVAKFIYNNKQYFAGISLMHQNGSLEYNQAPFSEVKSVQELYEEYGEGVLLASGLIVDGLHAFNGNLWKACMYVLSKDLKLEGSRESVFYKKDWIRRAKKFAKNYFKNNLEKMTYCIKDVHRFYRFNTIKKSMKQVDWSKYREEGVEAVEVDTLGSASCVGVNGTCEIV